jgi:antagonist of KipI
MEITVLRPGICATIQDTGFRGLRAAGVPLGGAADPFALRIANLLVGNPENAAGIEFALDGPELQFAEACTVALGGAVFAGVPAWRPWTVAAGERLRFGECRHGFYGYLAVRGGIDVPPVLGSRSTFIRGGWGGVEGRTLRAGDRLPVGIPPGGARAAPAPALFVSPGLLPPYASAPTVRVLAGAQAAELDPLTAGEFKVTSASDRMGLRLQGPAIRRRSSAELRSSPVAPGTVQVPPDGQPIVLLAEAQTIGGYPQAAHVIAVDLPVVAQLRPGETLRFQLTSREEAERRLQRRERDFSFLRSGLRAHWGAAE